MKSTEFETGEQYARKMDLNDPLGKFRERFHTRRGVIYLNGNSLGLLSKDAYASLLRVVNEWKTLGIRGWLEARPPWFYLAENLGSVCAKLVGAKPEELVATGTTTINIHSLVNTFYKPCGRKRRIIADELDFPSDIYALKSAIELRGLDPDVDLLLAPSKDGRFLEESEIVELMDDRVALIFLPSVLYRSGQLLNMQYLVEEAHSRGIPIGFDCCHSVGIVEHHFDKLDLDFAVWCSYKYLNGGPGSKPFCISTGGISFASLQLLAGLGV